MIVTIDVGESPRDLCWNSIQNRIYVANNGNSSVSVIRDSLIGIEEDERLRVTGSYFVSTIFRGPLQLTDGKTCKVFDITGRVVEHDRIQPGIYFIEVDGVITQKVVKVR